MNNISLMMKIKKEMGEYRINRKVVLLFIPVAFLTFLFHEFGHWITGEFLGNEMVMNLNDVSARGGYYLDNSHNLFISMGGPVFTLFQALISLLLIQLTHSIYIYPFVFFAAFSRFFSIIFGGFSLQDEARISSILGIGSYSVAAIVLLTLSLIVWRSNYLLKLNPKGIGYYTVLSTLSILMVIGANKLIIQCLG